MSNQIRISSLIHYVTQIWFCCRFINQQNIKISLSVVNIRPYLNWVTWPVFMRGIDFVTNHSWRILWIIISALIWFSFFYLLYMCVYVCIVFIKFHYWNLSGYSYLSVEEEIVGRRERICVKWILGEKCGRDRERRSAHQSKQLFSSGAW